MKKINTWSGRLEAKLAKGPILLLGCIPGTSSFSPHLWKFKPGRKWQWIEHQSAGTGCHHPQFVATELTWKPGMREAFASLDAEYFDTSLGVFGVALADLVKYSQRLQGIDKDLTCERCYSDLEESVYPIDCTAAAIAALSSDSLPAELDELVDWSGDLDRLIGCIGRWRLWVISENSD